MKIDFKKDLITKGDYNFKEWRDGLHNVKGRKSGTYYNSEVSDFYHKGTYGKNIVEILFEQGNDKIPKCPITGSFVSYKLQGKILFGEYSSSVSISERNKHVAMNNSSYIAHVEKMKIDRKGEGNPMFEKEAWNKGLTKDNDERVKMISENRKGIKFSDETLQKMSESAKVRDVHGHTGCFHSEETKQILREITIARYKNGIYSHHVSQPHLKVREIIENIGFKDWEEEFSLHGFSFDFRIGKTLIEVQGDFFHANPETRYSAATHDVQIKNVERDERKRDSIESDPVFNLVEIWESQINDDLKLIKEKLECLKK